MTDNKKPREFIKHAAVKSKDGQIFLGKCHADCFEQAHNIGIKMSQKADDQGFMTGSGRFVDRSEASIIAFHAKQTDELLRYLFSEMLWSPQDGGKHDYDSVEGYVLKEKHG